MRVELTKEQIEALTQILDNTQIKGSDAEFIVNLKNALKKGDANVCPTIK